MIYFQINHLQRNLLYFKNVIKIMNFNSKILKLSIKIFRIIHDHQFNEFLFVFNSALLTLFQTQGFFF